MNIAALERRLARLEELQDRARGPACYNLHVPWFFDQPERQEYANRVFLNLHPAPAGTKLVICLLELEKPADQELTEEEAALCQEAKRSQLASYAAWDARAAQRAQAPIQAPKTVETPITDRITMVERDGVRRYRVKPREELREEEEEAEQQ